MNTASEFQNRRRRAGHLALPWLVVGGCGLIVNQLLFPSHDESILITLAFFASIMVGVIIGAYIYRCPNCDKVPADDGVSFDPTTCPSCGAPLK